MRKFRFLIGIVLSLIGVLALVYVAMSHLNSPDFVDIAKVEPNYRLEAKTIIDLGKNQDSNYLRTENVVEIRGVVKEINDLNDRITILLGTNKNELSCIICDMQSNQKEKITKLKPNDTIKIKGVFKGFLQDAIFLNCVISE
ncbi:OB-fold protein [Spongiivirga citrea]|uniref:tRNA_anti-like n=1 Tax=Spongiivirga citrea TaxID=1481457 RepID=A0A6M0CRZ6_9FLAO|nr:hypothetical protein [Spongiivirga citrea]NER18874.1 hypothetical protein [Spongiivirga citrea]